MILIYGHYFCCGATFFCFKGMPAGVKKVVTRRTKSEPCSSAPLEKDLFGQLPATPGQDVLLDDPGKLFQILCVFSLFFLQIGDQVCIIDYLEVQILVFPGLVMTADNIADFLDDFRLCSELLQDLPGNKRPFPVLVFGSG